MEKASHVETKTEAGSNSVTSDSVSVSTIEAPSTVDSSSRLLSSPVSAATLTTVVAARSPMGETDSLLPSTVGDSGLQSDAVDVQPSREGASGSLADSVVDATAASADVTRFLYTPHILFRSYSYNLCFTNLLFCRSDAPYVSGSGAAAPLTVSDHNVSVQILEVILCSVKRICIFLLYMYLCYS